MPRRKKHEAPDDDTPWSEAQWEAFMKKSDLRSARYGEPLETLIDDPDREGKIAREMGWNFDEDDPADEAEDDADDEEKFDAKTFMNEIAADVEAECEANETAGEDPFAEYEREREADMRAIPAYAAATALGDKVNALFKPLNQADEKISRSEDEEEWLGQAFIGIHIAAAKIIAGHGMGYEDEVLGGNIVNCKRALEGAQSGLEAWTMLLKTPHFTKEAKQEMIAGHTEAIRLINERIAELRKKVWW